jgi:hypothetical protein
MVLRAMRMSAKHKAARRLASDALGRTISSDSTADVHFLDPQILINKKTSKSGTGMICIPNSELNNCYNQIWCIYDLKAWIQISKTASLISSRRSGIIKRLKSLSYESLQPGIPSDSGQGRN